MRSNYHFLKEADTSTQCRYQRDKMYCLPWVKEVVEAVTVGEAVGDSAVFDDLVPVAVVDDVVLEVDTSPRTVVSGAEK